MNNNEKNVPALAWHDWVIILIFFGSLPALLLIDPIAQDLGYHVFADRRSWVGIPNFFDVFSNVPFLFLGIWGVIDIYRHRPVIAPGSWVVFFLSVVLISAGSAYYHWRPNNATLVWDRLPITMAFMSLFVVFLSEVIARRLTKLLLPMLLVGGASVLYWHINDDLRLYLWTQLMPILVILWLLVVYPQRCGQRRYWWYCLGFYLLAKLFEVFDNAVYSATGELVSGHSLKHIAAATSVACLLMMLRKRRGVDV